LVNIKDDYENFYLSKNSLIQLGSGIGCAGILANTSMDGDIQEFYQDNVRSDATDDLSKVLKVPGDFFITPPILLGAYISYLRSLQQVNGHKSL
jgi:hypothetical protein